MRTTLDLDAELLEEAMRASGEKTKTATIERGLKKLIEEAAARRLAALAGRIPDAEAPQRRRPSRPHPSR